MPALSSFLSASPMSPARPAWRLAQTCQNLQFSVLHHQLRTCESNLYTTGADHLANLFALLSDLNVLGPIIDAR